MIILLFVFLVKNGANSNHANRNGWTPLIAASHNGHNDVVNVLLEWNVPINMQSME